MFGHATSCWAGRKVFGNSADFFETDASLLRTLHRDWRLARTSNKMERLVLHHELLVISARQAANAEARRLDGDLEEEEVSARWSVEETALRRPPKNASEEQKAAWLRAANAQVKEVLSRYVRALYGAFDYYAVMYSDTNQIGETDVFNVSFSAFNKFVRDCKIVGKNCSLASVETIWVQVNYYDQAMRPFDHHRQRRVMCRWEFLQAIVRLAIARYCVRDASTVASAVERMCSQHIIENLPEEAEQDSNGFRLQCVATTRPQVLSALFSA